MEELLPSRRRTPDRCPVKITMHSDSLHRLAKSLLDSGEAASIADALSAFSKYGVRVTLGADARSNRAAQTIALTVINCASRSLMGNVLVESSDFALTAPGFAGWTLRQFEQWAGVRSPVPPLTSNWPTIVVGAPEIQGGIRPWARGWYFGIGSAECDERYFPPACVAAAGWAVSEAFSVLRSDNPYAGRRAMTFSLWRPGVAADLPDLDEVAWLTLPGAWLVGLGHLGQAYAWALGFMRPSSKPLFLQDFDDVSAANLSTSLLCTQRDIGMPKTRVTAHWLEARGFKTALVERRFNDHLRVGADEPSVALFGVDNPVARRACEFVGFSLVVDVGLGAGHRDFRAIRMRTFPGPSRAAELWAAGPQQQPSTLASAYQQLLSEGADRCGVTTLASRAVGAPFVGCVAAGYAIAELVRRTHRAPDVGYLDLDLRDHRVEVG